MQVSPQVAYKGDGATKTFSIPFDYLSRGHVAVTVDKKTQPFEWLNQYTISFSTAPASGAEIKIMRNTPYNEAWVKWQNGSIMLADELNAQQMQTLFVLQENMYRIFEIENVTSQLPELVAENKDMAENFAKYAPVPFGGFYIEDGCLMLRVYGNFTNDRIKIDENGDLVILDADEVHDDLFEGVSE